MSSSGSDAPLTPRKRRLLAELVRRRQQQGVAQGTIPRTDRARDLPLSYGQERLWFLDQLAPGNPFYNDCEAFRIRGPLDVDALGTALDRLVERHEILRTTFPLDAGRPRQEIAPELSLELELVDLAGLPSAERRDRTLELARQAVDRPFDLERLPLVRFRLVRHAPEEHILLFVLHHIVFDGWSLGVFLEELAAFYDAETSGAEPDLPPLRVQYADFAVWQRRRVEEQLLGEQLGYWRRQLTAPLPSLDLKTDHPRPEQPSYRGRLQPIDLGEELSRATRELARRENVTLFVALLAAYEVLLYSLSGETDLIVGTPIANRNHSDIEPLLGFFLNTLALRTDLGGDPSFRGLLERVAETNAGASENQELPFEKLVAELNPERQLNYNPLFQVWFTLLSAPLPKLEAHGLSLEFAEIETRTARFDLALILWQDGARIRGHFEYARDLFEAATVTSIAERYRLVLERVVHHPERRLSELVAALEQTSRRRQESERRRQRRKRSERLSELRGRRRGAGRDRDE